MTTPLGPPEPFGIQKRTDVSRCSSMIPEDLRSSSVNLSSNIWRLRLPFFPSPGQRELEAGNSSVTAFRLRKRAQIKNKVLYLHETD